MGLQLACYCHQQTGKSDHQQRAHKCHRSDQTIAPPPAAPAPVQRASCLSSYLLVTEEDINVFEAHGLLGVVSAFTQMSASTPAHLEQLRFLENGFDLAGDGVMYSTGLSLRGASTGV